MARSTRQRKAVNYRRLLGDASEDSDDDFTSGPPTKKCRGAVGKDDQPDIRGSKDRQTKPASIEEGTKKPIRLSRDEKLFSRQMEQALAASKNEGSSDTSTRSITDTLKKDSTGAKATQDDEFVPDRDEGSYSEGESYSAVDEDEDSDFAASPEPKKGKKTGKENTNMAPKSKKVKSKRVAVASKSKSVVNSTSTSDTASTKPLSSVNAAVRVTKVKSEVQTPSLSSTKGINLPGNQTGAGGSPAVVGVKRRSVNWTPPARIGESKTSSPVCIKSTHPSGGGGTPVIRLGLSRNARVKSLHTNIKT